MTPNISVHSYLLEATGTCLRDDWRLKDANQEVYITSIRIHNLYRICGSVKICVNSQQYPRPIDSVFRQTNPSSTPNERINRYLKVATINRVEARFCLIIKTCNSKFNSFWICWHNHIWWHNSHTTKLPSYVSNSDLGVWNTLGLDVSSITNKEFPRIDKNKANYRKSK